MTDADDTARSESEAIRAEEAVERGARLLDAKRPGWWRAIDRERLNIDDSADCILGQLYGHFERGFDALGAPPGGSPLWMRALWMKEHGFDVFPEPWLYDVLHRAWEDQIGRRQEAARHG